MGRMSMTIWFGMTPMPPIKCFLCLRVACPRFLLFFFSFLVIFSYVLSKALFLLLFICMILLFQKLSPFHRLNSFYRIYYIDLFFECDVYVISSILALFVLRSCVFAIQV